MTGYLLPLACPRCGSVLDHVTSGRPVAGTEVSAICKCSGCSHEFQVQVHLRPTSGFGTQGCGTAAGYKRHQRAKEPACDACLFALREDAKHRRPSRATT